jgi:hypothetical protein
MQFFSPNAVIYSGFYRLSRLPEYTLKTGLSL